MTRKHDSRSRSIWFRYWNLIEKAATQQKRSRANLVSKYLIEGLERDGYEVQDDSK